MGRCSRKAHSTASCSPRGSVTSTKYSAAPPSSSVVSGASGRFLLIDADHSYEGVRRDFEAWSPLVAPGGLIVFHDYLMSEAGVARFVH